jgi:hypothetical protein
MRASATRKELVKRVVKVSNFPWQFKLPREKIEKEKFSCSSAIKNPLSALQAKFFIV